MRPDKEAEDGDRDRGERDCGIAKDPLLGKAGHHFGDDSHARKDHDVYGGMGVEPEEMLKEERVASYRRVEDSDAEDALEHEKRPA